MAFICSILIVVLVELIKGNGACLVQYLSVQIHAKWEVDEALKRRHCA
jgi:hypothetical protein